MAFNGQSLTWTFRSLVIHHLWGSPSWNTTPCCRRPPSTTSLAITYVYNTPLFPTHGLTTRHLCGLEGMPWEKVFPKTLEGALIGWHCLYNRLSLALHAANSSAARLWQFSMLVSSLCLVFNFDYMSNLPSQVTLISSVPTQHKFSANHGRKRQ